MKFSSTKARGRALHIVKARLFRQITLEKLGKEYGISRQRVWEILRRFVEDLEDDFEAKTHVSSFDDLSIRTRNRLWKAGYRTLESIPSKSPEDLLRLRGFGIRSYFEVKALLESVKSARR